MTLARFTTPHLTFAVALLGLAGAGRISISAGPGASPAQAAVQVAPEHPKVEAGDEDCESCHREKTPVIVRRWEGSAHGANSTKCVACHGTLGDKDFTTRPAMATCDVCHAEQVETLKSAAPIMKDKTCFSCHDPHALSPHAAIQGGK